MGAPYEIPFEPQAQTFVIALGGVPYRLSTAWNGAGGYWTLDVSTAAGAPLAMGIPIVTGADLLGQLAYLGIGGRVVVQGAGDGFATPGYADLGAGALVFFVTP